MTDDAIREMHRKVIAEALNKFAPSGVTEIIATIGEREGDPNSQRCTLAFRSGNAEMVLSVTDYEPEPVFREVMDYFVREQEYFLRDLAAAAA